MNKLIDNFGREISYLRVSITDRCNYRCIYCQSEKEFEFIPHQEILRFEEIVEIVQEAVNLGITKVRITGGEPLVRKGVVNFIKKLREIKKLEDISLTTNAFFLSEYAKKLKDAGLNRVNISLDSLQEEKYKKITRGGSLEKALKGIDSAFKTGLLPIKINTVLIRGINDDEVEDFVRLTLGRPLNIRFIVSVLEIKEKLIKKYLLDPVKISTANGPAKYYQIKGGQGTIGFINALSQHFCKTCNRIRLTSEGKLRPCLFSNKEIDIKKAIRKLVRDKDERFLRKEIIRNKLKEAVKLKPKGHKLNIKNQENLSFHMSRIGG
jgi:cyclic pyranopterin phosphate synthase